MLNINSDKNIMYFSNDDEFSDFCINPVLKVYTVQDEDGIDHMYCDYEFTEQYKNAVSSGKRFCIKDLASHVNKDGLLGYRNTTKVIDNIERYYGEE